MAQDETNPVAVQQGPPVVGQILIELTADGNVRAQCRAPNLPAMVMMCETAKLQLYEKLSLQVKQASEAPIAVPNPNGLLIAGGM